MKKIILTIALFLTITFLPGCSMNDILVDKSNPILDDNDATEESVNGVVEANNKFALDLYGQYKDKKGENIFFSPYSISSALAMTYEGARGQTAEEIQSVFYFSKDENARRVSYAKLYNDINKKNKGYQLNVANALWAEQDYKFLDEYFNLISQYYGGKVTNLDFKQKSEDSRIIINNWVEGKTNDKIKNLIPSGMINPGTRLVLTNAVYFKGKWEDQFKKESTIDRDFRLTPNNTIKVPTMQQTGEEAKFKYTENDIVQVLELPYIDEELSMLILLPRNDDLDQLEKNLDINQLSEWKNNLKKQRVDVYFPKFRFETKYFMKDALSKMGMPLAFNNADFSGMTGQKDLFISDVIHQAFVEVNEEGTEAAAATAVVMKDMSSGLMTESIPVFRVDHPFIFLIQENNTGNILFMGRVNNPSI